NNREDTGYLRASSPIDIGKYQGKQHDRDDDDAGDKGPGWERSGKLIRLWRNSSRLLQRSRVAPPARLRRLAWKYAALLPTLRTHPRHLSRRRVRSTHVAWSTWLRNYRRVRSAHVAWHTRRTGYRPARP